MDRRLSSYGSHICLIIRSFVTRVAPAGLIATSLLIPSVAPAMGNARKIVKTVKMGGATFKVVQRGNDVVVTRQALIVKLNRAYYALAARAAEYASGCIVVSAFTQGPAYSRDKVYMVLNCALRSAPPPSDVQVRD